MTLRYNCGITAAAASRVVVLYAYLILSYRGWYSTVGRVAEAVRLVHQQQSDVAADDVDNDHRENDKLFDWLNDEDDYADSSDEDYGDLSPVRIDEDLAGRMTGFFNKLNSLRQRHRETRQKSKYQPFKTDHNRADNIPFGADDTEPVVIDISHHHAGHRPLVDSTPLSQSVMMDNEQQTGWKNDITISEASTRSPFSIDANNTDQQLACDKLRRTRLATGYLHMGWRSARCLWHQYNGLGTTATERELSQTLRQHLKSLAWFWTAVVGVSVLLLWSAFGCFHELFCVGIVAPPATYAKDVNRYLTMVPPHVVVTNKAKMFKYRPTAKERFLWRTAKKIANFKM